MISHEIRTPLSVIIGYSDLLLSGLNDSNSLDQSLKSIRKNGQHLLQLINDILDISAIESGKIEMRSVPIFLAHEIDGAVDQLRSMALGKKTKIQVIYQHELPVLVQADPLRLRQVIVNLVSNAIKFTSKGKIEIVVSLLSHLSVSILVKDTGIGIEKKMWNYLFKPFSQISAEFSSRQQGTGLGLFLSKKIANLMGGDLVLKSSAPNLGSVFEFTFSLNVVNQTSRSNIEEKNLELNPAFLADYPVLLVEDNLEIQSLYAEYLRSFACRVTVVDNGLDAIKLANKHVFGLILMDIQIPIINGYDAAKTILAKDSRIPIIALTSHIWKGEHQRCLDLGFKDLISKPVTKNFLIKRISRWL
ncbi:MAG: ATP-binding protein [Oligoflexales bacterium]